MVAMNETRRRKARPKQVGNTPKSRAAGAVGYVKDQALVASRQAKQSARDAAQALLVTARDQVEQVYGRHKGRLVARVNRVGTVVKQAAHALHAVKADAAADYVEVVSRSIRRATNYLETRPLPRMLDDAGDVVRQNRALTTGGLFLLGFAAARLLLATEARAGESAHGSGSESAAAKRRRNGTTQTVKRRARVRNRK
jgi:hypothetical protein